jgi:hypothetical protein
MASKKSYRLRRALLSFILVFLVLLSFFNTPQGVKASPQIKVSAIKFECTYEYSLSDRGTLITYPIWTGDLLVNITKNRPASLEKIPK